jgi:hypothetical protein
VIQLCLFPKAPRRKPRKLMHVCDAGHHPCISGKAVQFECGHCGYVSDWLPGGTVSEDKRGRPCPRCNPVISEGAA